MTTLYPRAVWREVTSEANDPPIIPVGVILHVAGGEAESLFGYFDGPSGGIESHLHIARAPKPDGGGIEQYRDLENEADANYHGNSWIGADGRRYGFLSVETQGGADGEWGEYQLDELARFLAWASARFRFPLELCTNPKDPGIGWHVMWGAPGEWTPAEGKVCPGPDRIRQVPAVIARARQIAAGEGGDHEPIPPEADDPDDQEDEMLRLFKIVEESDNPGGWPAYGYDSRTLFHWKNPTELGTDQRFGVVAEGDTTVLAIEFDRYKSLVARRGGTVAPCDDGCRLDPAG